MSETASGTTRASLYGRCAALRLLVVVDADGGAAVVVVVVVAVVVDEFNGCLVLL